MDVTNKNKPEKVVNPLPMPLETPSKDTITKNTIKKKMRLLMLTILCLLWGIAACFFFIFIFSAYNYTKEGNMAPPEYDKKIFKQEQEAGKTEIKILEFKEEGTVLGGKLQKLQIYLKLDVNRSITLHDPFYITILGKGHNNEPILDCINVHDPLDSKKKYALRKGINEISTAITSFEQQNPTTSQLPFINGKAEFVIKLKFKMYSKEDPDLEPTDITNIKNVTGIPDSTDCLSSQKYPQITSREYVVTYR